MNKKIIEQGAVKKELLTPQHYRQIICLRNGFKNNNGRNMCPSEKIFMNLSVRFLTKQNDVQRERDGMDVSKRSVQKNPDNQHLNVY
jgi:hypothetical protein